MNAKQKRGSVVSIGLPCCEEPSSGLIVGVVPGIGGGREHGDRPDDLEATPRAFPEPAELAARDLAAIHHELGEGPAIGLFTITVCVIVSTSTRLGNSWPMMEPAGCENAARREVPTGHHPWIESDRRKPLSGKDDLPSLLI